MFESFVKAVGAIVIGFLVVIGISIVLMYPVMWAWNYVMPYMFGLKVITIWHAWCLNFLAGCFIKQSYVPNTK